MTRADRPYILLVVLTIFWWAGILAAPLAASGGAGATSDALTQFYGRVCHQMPARSFTLAGGNVAVCHRCTGIYGGWLAGLMLLMIPRVRRTAGHLPPGLFLVMVVPMAVDAVANDMGLLAASMGSRVVTGFLAGGAAAWFVVPLLLEAWLQLSSASKRKSIAQRVTTDGR